MSHGAESRGPARGEPWWQPSPLARRRLDRLLGNRRGVVSGVIFCVVVLVSLASEVVANDRPLLVVYRGEAFFPVLMDYPESAFGGELPTLADFGDPALRRRIEADGWLIFAPIEHDWESVDFTVREPAPAPPRPGHWLGTDDQGRDVAARLLYGLRVSLLFGFCLTGLSALIGIGVGAVSGYVGGWLDLLVQRALEVWGSLPVTYLLIIVVNLIEPSFFWLLGILLAFGWMAFVGVVRAEVLRVRNFDYVRAARALGASESRIVRRHVLPNALVATLTFLPFSLVGSLTLLTALDFLGIGLPPGSASLGEMLAQGRAHLDAPWLVLAGFGAVTGLLGLLVFVGEALRDAFDSRHLVTE